MYEDDDQYEQIGGSGMYDQPTERPKPDDFIIGFFVTEVIQPFLQRTEFVNWNGDFGVDYELGWSDWQHRIVDNPNGFPYFIRYPQFFEVTLIYTNVAGEEFKRRTINLRTKPKFGIEKTGDPKKVALFKVEVLSES